MSDIDTSKWTQRDVRTFYDFLSDWTGDWQGIPVSLGDDLPLTLTPGHPLRDVLTPPPSALATVDNVEDGQVINMWWSRQRQANVFVVNRGGVYSALLEPLSPDRSMDRLDYWVRTIGACDAWGLEAEHRARATLRAMLSERQWHHYDLCGSFLETSPRSGLTYVFRRLRPTIALSPRQPWFRRGADTMRCLAVLCMHPIGYYQATWAGCMVPSDDIIAHVAWMRGDEAGYWKHANQHDLATPEAGL